LSQFLRIAPSQFGQAETGYLPTMINACPTPSGRAETAPSAQKSMIYVVDDDYDVLKSLRFLLETEGFEVRTFRSGSALLGSPARQGADCLVVDYKMAGMDGLELAERLRRLDVSAPIVMITGYPDTKIAAKAHSAGVRQVLLKPNLEDNLVECVRNAINSSGSSPEKSGEIQLRKTP
jgi:two-component system, LuxR family, response regulator FixJ